MSQFYNDSIFWIEVEKIHPNPFQPRREFDQMQLQSLADSMRQYGVLQALVVTRNEVEKPEGGIAVEYELIAGERRLRAAKLAGLKQVPVLIRNGAETDLTKLELAIIENIQREDLNPVDRAKAFDRLAKEFGFKHAEIGKKVGKSREYVSNTLRLLMLPEHMLQALSDGKITEGHTRPLMMLTDRKEEQETLFKEIMFKKLNVREAESIARHIAIERARKLIDPELIEMEDRFKETLGTRVRIEKKEKGGRVTIDFFS
ncbi:MAG: ParB/RepB/Spo0J family partition protein [Patescibacteria group bacterium]